MASASIRFGKLSDTPTGGVYRFALSDAPPGAKLKSIASDESVEHRKRTCQLVYVGDADSFYGYDIIQVKLGSRILGWYDIKSIEEDVAPKTVAIKAEADRHFDSWVAKTVGEKTEIEDRTSRPSRIDLLTNETWVSSPGYVYDVGVDDLVSSESKNVYATFPEIPAQVTHEVVGGIFRFWPMYNALYSPTVYNVDVETHFTSKMANRFFYRDVAEVLQEYGITVWPDMSPVVQRTDSIGLVRQPRFFTEYPVEHTELLDSTGTQDLLPGWEVYQISTGQLLRWKPYSKLIEIGTDSILESRKFEIPDINNMPGDFLQREIFARLPQENNAAIVNGWILTGRANNPRRPPIMLSSIDRPGALIEMALMRLDLQNNSMSATVTLTGNENITPRQLLRIPGIGADTEYATAANRINYQDSTWRVKAVRQIHMDGLHTTEVDVALWQGAWFPSLIPIGDVSVTGINRKGYGNGVYLANVLKWITDNELNVVD